MDSLKILISIVILSISLAGEIYSKESNSKDNEVKKLTNELLNNQPDLTEKNIVNIIHYEFNCNERVLSLSQSLESGQFQNNSFRIIHPSDPWTFRKLPSIDNDNCGNKTLVYEISIKNPASWKNTRWRSGHTVYFDREHLEENSIPSTLRAASRVLSNHIQSTMGLRGIPGVDGRASHIIQPKSDDFQIRKLTFQQWDGDGSWEERAERTGINQGQGDYYVEELVATVAIDVRWNGSNNSTPTGNNEQEVSNQAGSQINSSTEQEVAQQRINTLVSRAENFLEANQFDLAINNFTRARRLDPERTAYYNQRIAAARNMESEFQQREEAKAVDRQREEAETIAEAYREEQERIERQSEGLAEIGNTLGFAAAGLMKEGMALGLRAFFLDCPTPGCSGVGLGGTFMKWGADTELFGIDLYPIISGAAVSFAFNFETSDYVPYREVERQHNYRTITDKFVSENINVPSLMFDLQLMNNSLGLNFLNPVFDVGLHFAIPYKEGEDFVDVNRSHGKPFLSFGLGAGLVVDKFLSIIVTHNMKWNVWTGTVGINLFE